MGEAYSAVGPGDRENIKFSSTRSSSLRKAEGTGGVRPLDHQAIFFALVVRLLPREKLVHGRGIYRGRTWRQRNIKFSSTRNKYMYLRKESAYPG